MFEPQAFGGSPDLEAALKECGCACVCQGGAGGGGGSGAGTQQ